ncbi:MAG: TolC family protein [Bryobacteraceae bacterium]|nr:TolC family protein [Bryobacteraceae bacterium]
MALAAAAWAQEAPRAMTLREAVKQALSAHPSLEAARAKVTAAAARVEQARSGHLPRLKYEESFQSGNNPVYVFGTLLTQRQFTSANFALDSLNRPDPINNFQSKVTAEQLIYDFGGLKNNIKAADLGRQMSEQDRKAAELGLLAGVTKTYLGAQLAAQALTVAREAEKSAEADLARAQKMQAAGLITEADVLSLKVHAAAMREQVIRAEANRKVSLAALNEALGLPLETVLDLTTPLAAALAPAGDAEKQALQSRPELGKIQLASEAAEAQAAAARAGYYPRIAMRGIFEADRQQFVNKGGANWMFGAGLEWNLFDGNRTRASVAEAKAQSAASQASLRQYQSAVRLEVKQAQAMLDAASERLKVTEAGVAQSEESLRILRNRYQNGLATVTDLLRAQVAVSDARMRRLQAIHDQRLAAVEIQRAAGILNGDSDVLN